MHWFRSWCSVMLVALSACSHAAHGSAASSDIDRAFVAAMVPHHELGVRLIDDAVPRVDDVRLRRLIFKMASYHDAELHRMEHYLEDWGVEPLRRYPGWVDPARLSVQTMEIGRRYDVGWLVIMIEHHEGAVALATDQAGNGGVPELRSLASDIATAQSAEIAAMTELLVELCEESPRTPGCADIAGPAGRG